MIEGKLIRLVDLVLTENMRPARAIVMELLRDARTGKIRLSEIVQPNLLGHDKLALCAALIEHLAAQVGQAAPLWTKDVGVAETPTYLVKFGLPKMKAFYESESPEPFRRHGFYAPAGYLVPV